MADIKLDKKQLFSRLLKTAKKSEENFANKLKHYKIDSNVNFASMPTDTPVYKKSGKNIKAYIKHNDSVYESTFSLRNKKGLNEIIGEFADNIAPVVLQNNILNNKNNTNPLIVSSDNYTSEGDYSAFRLTATQEFSGLNSNNSSTFVLNELHINELSSSGFDDGNYFIYAHSNSLPGIDADTTAKFSVNNLGNLYSAGDLTLGGEIYIADSKKLYLGSDNDLQIYHDGSDGYIADPTGTHLKVLTNQFQVKNAAGGENMAKFTQNDSVKLYYDNSLKFETTNTGADITGTLEFDSLSDGTITITDFVDEDNMASNSATKIPTQQSVKAYVDSEITGLVDSAPGALDPLNELPLTISPSWSKAPVGFPSKLPTVFLA